MLNMQSFYIVITTSIKAKTFEREYYEQVIATWHLNGWLTEQEKADALSLLDESCPLDPPEEP